MQLKHLNLVTPEVAGLTAFFERFFGFERVVDHKSGGFALMRNDDDFILAVMKPKKRDPAHYPDMFHVGFYLDDAAALQAKHQELTAAGLSPGEIHPADSGGRSSHFYCTAPGQVLIEIAAAPHPRAAA
jgi:catechol 2,3-dioxygenase-like lactoylglutathione lyase family enzyme